MARTVPHAPASCPSDFPMVRPPPSRASPQYRMAPERPRHSIRTGHAAPKAAAHLRSIRLSRQRTSSRRCCRSIRFVQIRPTNPLSPRRWLVHLRPRRQPCRSRPLIPFDPKIPSSSRFARAETWHPVAARPIPQTGLMLPTFHRCSRSARKVQDWADSREACSVAHRSALADPPAMSATVRTVDQAAAAGPLPPHGAPL